MGDRGCQGRAGSESRCQNGDDANFTEIGTDFTQWTPRSAERERRRLDRPRRRLITLGAGRIMLRAVGSWCRREDRSPRNPDRSVIMPDEHGSPLCTLRAGGTLTRPDGIPTSVPGPPGGAESLPFGWSVVTGGWIVMSRAVTRVAIESAPTTSRSRGPRKEIFDPGSPGHSARPTPDERSPYAFEDGSALE